MNTRNNIIALIIIVIAFSGCKKNSVEPLPSTITAKTTNTSNAGYTPINIGDVRQIVNLADSSTILMNIVGTRKRSDSVDVFIMEWTYGTQPPDTLYYLIKDGFFTGTNITADSNSVNPFEEQRIGKVNPVNNETWQNFIGYSDSSFVIASYYKDRSTLCGTFPDVYGFTFTYRSSGIIDTILTAFYADNIGYIRTDYNKNAQGLTWEASYIKVANQVYGTLWPAKDLSSPGLSKRSVSNNIIVNAYSLLGNKDVR